MAEEPENQQEQTDEPAAEAEEQAPAAEEPAAEESAGEAPAEEAPAEEEPAAEEPAEEPAAGEETAAEGGEPPAPAESEPAGEAPAAEAEQLSPKQRRKRERAEAKTPARPQRSPEERAGERGDARRRNAAARSRWRSKRREKRRAAGPSIVPAAPEAVQAEPGKRKMRQGVVVSDRGDKTITVRIDAVHRHRVYGKVVRESTTLHAHDESNEASTGDLVRVVESRPLSRTKRWRLVEVLEKAR
jgi:small subunit ribosomal protein S17